jgi:hypothetical protein
MEKFKKNIQSNFNEWKEQEKCSQAIELNKSTFFHWRFSC